MTLLKIKTNRPLVFWVFLSLLTLGMLNSSDYQKEETKDALFVGTWEGIFQEYEWRADTSIKVMEWSFDLILYKNGTGSFGRFKPVSWDWNEKGNKMFLLIKDNPGGVFPDIQTVFEVTINNRDSQRWTYRYDGRARMVNGVEKRVPVERVWDLKRKR